MFFWLPVVVFFSKCYPNIVSSTVSPLLIGNYLTGRKISVITILWFMHGAKHVQLDSIVTNAHAFNACSVALNNDHDLNDIHSHRWIYFLLTSVLFFLKVLSRNRRCTRIKRRVHTPVLRDHVRGDWTVECRRFRRNYNKFTSEYLRTHIAVSIVWPYLRAANPNIIYTPPQWFAESCVRHEIVGKRMDTARFSLNLFLVMSTTTFDVPPPPALNVSPVVVHTASMSSRVQNPIIRSCDLRVIPTLKPLPWSRRSDLHMRSRCRRVYYGDTTIAI